MMSGGCKRGHPGCDKVGTGCDRLWIPDRDVVFISLALIAGRGHNLLMPATQTASTDPVALAAMMSEEDFPVVPTPDDIEAPPEPDDAALGCEGPESHWSSVLGRAILDDMRADDAAQEGSHYDFNEGQGHGYDGRYEPSHLRTWVNGLATERQFTFPSARMTSVDRSDARHEQRVAKKARAKRKAKKGWA